MLQCLALLDYEQAIALSLLPFKKCYLWLVVVLHRHGDDIEGDDNGDEQVQILALAHVVDETSCWGVIGVKGFTLGF